MKTITYPESLASADDLTTSQNAARRLFPSPINTLTTGSATVDYLSHRTYLNAVCDVLSYRLNEPERKKILGAEILYGAGRPNVYGTCFYSRWRRDQIHDVVEVSAFGEESIEQLWKTLSHELGHVLAGPSAGHGPEWKAAAKRLGLRRPMASGPAGIQDLDPELMISLRQIPIPQDGGPVNRSALALETAGTSVVTAGSSCPLGIGTQGGTSRGPGSGSRLRLYMCECPKPHSVRVRVASDDFRARCLTCESAFQRVTTTERRPPPWR